MEFKINATGLKYVLITFAVLIGVFLMLAFMPKVFFTILVVALLLFIVLLIAAGAYTSGVDAEEERKRKASPWK